MPNLSKVELRERLKPQREPHWHDLATGCDLGYRPSRKGKPGTWICRFYDPDTRKRSFKSLGDFGQLAAKDRFGAAKKEAEEWFRHLWHGGSNEDPTVKDACEKYAGDDRELQRRFRQYVYGHRIANVKLQKLREHHVKEWRTHLENLPALVTRSKPTKKKTPEIVTRQRAASTVNRDMVPFRAALNAALSRGEVQTALAWKNALRPAEADGRRELYLDRDQRRALLANLPEDAATFCRGLCLLPLRPGAVAAFVAKDFEPRTGSLKIGADKAGAGRYLKLPEGHVTFFKEQAKGKLPLAPLFAQADGTAWNKDDWWEPIHEAAKAAGLPAGTSAYTLRHSTITDLVIDGLDLLTVAKLAGTSVRMIEKHYGHLRADHAAAALAQLAI